MQEIYVFVCILFKSNINLFYTLTNIMALTSLLWYYEIREYLRSSLIISAIS